MKRFLSFLVFTILWPIWRAPAWAQLTTLGVGGIAAVVIGTLITPTIVPQASSYFNQNATNGATNSALKPNGGSDTGTVESFGFPNPATNSLVLYIEGSVDSALTYGSQGAETAISQASNGLQLTGNGPALPAFLFQRNAGGGFGGSLWWNGTGPSTFAAAVTDVAGTGYATGQYPFTASGGGCAREPSGVWTGGSLAHLVDPGFLCGTAPTVDVSKIPGDGARQNTGPAASPAQASTTCVSNSPVAGEMTVTAHLAVAHGIAPAQTYTMQGFTAQTGYNATYIALPGTSGATLIGETTTGAGTCPASPATQEGTALSGINGGITFVAMSATNPYGIGVTGITSHNGQKFCAIVGEYGPDSNFPGAQFASFVDDKGNALPGAPALVPYLNEGAANFTGYVSFGAQSPSSPALTVTAMNPYAISAATFNATTGFATFTAAPNSGIVVGSEFTVSGVTNSGGGSFNLTYVAVAGTSGAQIVGNPLSGVFGTPQASALTGSSTMTGGASPQMVSVIMPNMQILGENVGLVTSPLGTFGGTGQGGIGTYALVGNPAATTITGKIDNGAGAAGTTLTTIGTPNPPLVVGSAISGAGVSAGTIVSAVFGTNSFSVNNSQLVATAESMTNAGTIGSVGAPVNIFAWSQHYFIAGAGITSTTPYGGVLVARTQSTLGDFLGIIGSTSLVNGQGKSGWGGSLANVSMLWGAFPQAAGGAPDTSKLAALCKKSPGNDLQSFAAANSLAVHSLYRLNDLGVWGDSGNATITGYIDGATNTASGTATLHVLTAPYGSLAPTANETAFLAGPGLAGVPISPPTIPLLSSGAASTYTVTFATGVTSANVGSSGSPVTFSVGAFKPAVPLASNSFNGYIDNGSGSTPTLHVTSIPSAATATFTATLGNTFTGNIPVGNTLNVTAVPGDGYTKIGVGTTVIGAGIPTGTVVTGAISVTNADGVGSYTLNNSVSTAVASEAMFATGVLPAAASNWMVSSVSAGTVAANMIVGDGGVNVTTAPLYISAAGPAVNGLATWIVNQTYLPTNITYPNLVGTLTTLVPGQYIQGTTAAVGLTTPVSIIGYADANTIGGVGNYLLSNGSSNGIGSVGSPEPFISTSIGDGGAIAPGPALTIKDLGAGVTFPVTNYSAGTGTITISGTYSAADLGGVPTTIQAQVSLTAGGPPVPGCSACAWTNLSGGVVAGGAWSGQVTNIPAGGPLFVSVRAANGQAYATMPSYMKVGLVFDWQGEGQLGALASGESGTANSYFVGLWGLNQFANGLLQGPPVVGNYLPAQTIMLAGDRFGVVGGGVPFPEGLNVYEQDLTTAFGGWPTTVVNTARDGIGITPETMGNVAQSQTIGVGDGATAIWCSDSVFCATAGVSSSGSLFFNAATQTGANITAKIDNGSGAPGNILTMSSLVLGALEPGMSVTGAGIAGSPTLVSCITGCVPVGNPAAYPNIQTWTISVSQSAVIASESMRLDPPGGAPWPGYNIQNISLSFVNGGFGSELVQPGTFQITVNGTVVCQDTNVFAYNSQSGNCTGAGIASSFVNYATGDYQVTFNAAPASNAAITASWTNIISPDSNVSPTLNRPQGFDFFGNGESDSGPISSAFAKTPGGVSAHVFAGGISDDRNLIISGFQFAAPGYTQAVSWLYATRFPALIPGQTASIPLISANYWRGEGADYFAPTSTQGQQADLFQQWSQDVATKSIFPGSIASGVLTLTAAATGPMWEGEVVDCVTISGGCPLNQESGVYITSLATGAWGASGSTYVLSGAGSITATGSMQNAVYYLGPGPAYYSGPMNDVPVQASNLAATTGYAPHMADGAFAGRRVSARWAAQTWAMFTNLANASDATLSRANDTAAGTPSPAFDYGNTYAAVHSGTIAGAQITITGGIAANARPFVDGQLITCAGCTTGRFITSIDVPPTQDNASGAGEVGQTFHITVNASLLTGPTTETVTAGCTPGSGGSNCFNVDFQQNTTNGTFGTAWSLATCGENNLNGNAPNYAPPGGVCQSNGIGSLVRTFRIGIVQGMNSFTAGSPYDDGLDTMSGVFNQSAAATCNIVAPKVVQCVKAPNYAAPATPVVGKWASGATFVEYGDPSIGSSRIASLQGFVGGQSFPITSAGSGQTPGTYPAVAGTGCGLAAGGVAPKMDLTIGAGGTLVNAYPSTANQSLGLAVGTGCLFSVPGSAGGTPGTVQTIVAPLDGWGGIATYNTDSNMFGDLLYGNEGLPGNPLSSFFTNGFGGYFEPGLPVVPFGQFMGAQVSG